MDSSTLWSFRGHWAARYYFEKYFYFDFIVYSIFRSLVYKRYQAFLAHLSRRLVGELIVYSCSGVHLSVNHFQRSSRLKALA